MIDWKKSERDVWFHFPANVNPVNSHVLTSVPSSVRWDRKERQRSPTCPCCVVIRWCCGRRHDILRLVRFLASTSFHQRGLAGNCLAESGQRLESKTWSGCVTELRWPLVDRVLISFTNWMCRNESTTTLNSSFVFVWSLQQARLSELLTFPTDSVLL